MIRIIRACVLAVLLGSPVGCDRERQAAPAGGRTSLLLYCGAGIQEPVEELAKAFEQANGVKMEVNYAGSETLLSTIKLHRKGDLYMPGDKHYVDLAEAEGLIAGSKPACYFVPCILVAKGNPKDIRGLADLIRPGVRLGLGDARACAVGRQARAIFEKNGIDWDDVAKTLEFQSLTVNELGVQVQAGSLDAVIVWDAIANQYVDHTEVIEIPIGQNIISTVEVGVLSFAPDRPLAERFVEFVTSPQGQAVFRKHLYRVDAPATRGS